MLLRFQRPAVRGSYETGDQAFSMHLRFLTIRVELGPRCPRSVTAGCPARMVTTLHGRLDFLKVRPDRLPHLATTPPEPTSSTKSHAQPKTQAVLTVASTSSTTKTRKLFESLARGEFNISRFQSKNLRRPLQDKKSAQVSRLLKRLRAHGLIRKNRKNLQVLPSRPRQTSHYPRAQG